MPSLISEGNLLHIIPLFRLHIDSKNNTIVSADKDVFLFN